MASESALLPRPRSRKPTGKNVGIRGVIARAAILSGKSVTESAALAGISRNTAYAIKSDPGMMDAAQVERIRLLLRDKATLKADLLLNHMTAKKATKVSSRAMIPSFLP